MLLCPRKQQFRRLQHTEPARIRKGAGSQEFTTFSKLAALTLVARANPWRTGSQPHTPATRPGTTGARSCDGASETTGPEGSQHTAAPESAAAPGTAKGSDTTPMRGEFSSPPANVKTDEMQMESICVGAFASPTPKNNDDVPFSPRSEIECATEAAKSMAHTEAGN